MGLSIWFFVIATVKPTKYLILTYLLKYLLTVWSFKTRISLLRVAPLVKIFLCNFNYLTSNYLLSFSEYQTIDMVKSAYFLNVIHMMLMSNSSSLPLFVHFCTRTELGMYFRFYSFYSFFYCFSLSVSSTGTDFLVWIWILAVEILFWFNFLFCVILRRNIGAWIHATFLRKYTCKWNLDILVYLPSFIRK